MVRGIQNIPTAPIGLQLLKVNELNSPLTSRNRYEVEGFLDKNRDTVHEEQLNILKASQVRLS